MPFTIACVPCRLRAEVPDGFSLKEVDCPRCGRVIPVVPAGPLPVPQLEDPPTFRRIGRFFADLYAPERLPMAACSRIDPLATNLAAWMGGSAPEPVPQLPAPPTILADRPEENAPVTARSLLAAVDTPAEAQEPGEEFDDDQLQDFGEQLPPEEIIEPAPAAAPEAVAESSVLCEAPTVTLPKPEQHTAGPQNSDEEPQCEAMTEPLPAAAPEVVAEPVVVSEAPTITLPIVVSEAPPITLPKPEQRPAAPGGPDALGIPRSAIQPGDLVFGKCCADPWPRRLGLPKGALTVHRIRTLYNRAYLATVFGDAAGAVHIPPSVQQGLDGGTIYGGSVAGYSKATLDLAAANGKRVLFDLSNVSVDRVRRGSAEAGPAALTEQELRHVLENRATFENAVRFYRESQPVSWDEAVAALV